MKFLFFILALSHGVSALAQKGPQGEPLRELICEYLLTSDLNQYYLAPRASGAVEVNGQVARAYPLSIVLRNLGLGEEFSFTPAKGPVLLIAEGFGQLLPKVVSEGSPVKAVDLWYGESHFPNTSMGENMKEYIQRFEPYLIPGSALDLPLADQSQNLVLSHMLLNNFAKHEERILALLEAVRVLKVGGEARFAYFSQGINSRQFVSSLKSNFGETIDIEVETLSTTFDFRESEIIAPDLQSAPPKTLAVDLLVIRKIH